jgi:hypothetical protein
MSDCAACGKPNANQGIGGVLICHQCSPDIHAEIETLRSDGKPVNVAHIARRIYRETNSAGNYLLRDIPQDLWDQAKHRAVDEGASLRDLILKALRSYLA